MATLSKNTTDLQSILDSVNALPDAVDTSGTATAADILSDKTATVNNTKLTGTMTNNGAISKTMNGTTVKSITIPAGYTSGGTVSMDSTVDNAVTAAITALTDKGVTVPDGTNVTGLADLIAAIESGGLANVVVGTYTPSIDGIASQEIHHELGICPKIAVYWWIIEQSTTFSANRPVFGFAINTNDNPVQMSARAYNSTKTSLTSAVDNTPITSNSASAATAFMGASEDKIYIVSNYGFKAGERYAYLLMGDAI